MKKHILTTTVLLLTSLFVFAQSWSKLGAPNNIFYPCKGSIISLLTSDNLGNIYVAGSFTDSISPTKGHRFVNKFNGSNWMPLGVSTNGLYANGGINGLVTDNNNNVYAAGSFTDSIKLNKGHCYVAKWNGSNWSQLGVGANALNPNSGITRMAINKSNGHIYVIGGFTNSIGRMYVAEWNGTNWSELGGSQSPFLNAPFGTESLNSISVDNTGNVFVGVGTSNQHYYVAKWDGTNWIELGTGSNSLNANNYIYSIAFDNIGNVYAAGLFTDSATSNIGNTYVAKWNGNIWSKLGTGSNALFEIQSQPIYSICTDNNNNIYAAGQFRNSLNKTYLAKWDGTSWDELGGISSFPAQNPQFLNSVITDKFGAVYTTGSILDSTRNNYVARYGLPLGVENIKESNHKLMVYPNPTNSQLTVYSHQFEVNTIEIMDVLGRVCTIPPFERGLGGLELNTKNFQSGIYFIKATDKKGNTMNGKFVKE